MTGFVWHGDHAVSRGLTIGISQEDSSALAATPIKAITRSALSEPRPLHDRRAGSRRCESWPRRSFSQQSYSPAIRKPHRFEFLPLDSGALGAGDHQVLHALVTVLVEERDHVRA
jgi:hypothetical protein